MKYNIRIWTVMCIETNDEGEQMPKVEIYTSSEIAMKRVCELVDFTSDVPKAEQETNKPKISCLSMCEYLI